MTAANVVDSSGWLEYFVDSPRADLFAPAIRDVAHLIVPVVCIYGVVKVVRRRRGDAAADRVADAMRAGRVVDIDLSLALEATRYPLPLADSLIYATARRHDATLWTQDEHFSDLPGVRYVPKSPAAAE